MPVWLKLSEYRKRAYAPGSAPDLRTLRRRIDSGELPGKREGGGPKAHYYVLVDEETGLEVRDGHPGDGPEAVCYRAGFRPVNRLAAEVIAKAVGGAKSGK